MGTILEMCKINGKSYAHSPVAQWGSCLLLSISIWLLLGTVCFYSPSIPVGAVSYQLLWLGRFSLIFSCVVAIQLFAWHRSLEELNNMFSWAITVGLIALGGIQAVWGLLQIYGYSVSHHALFKLTGSFYNPGPYSGYLAMIIPICLHGWLSGRKTVSLHQKGIAWAAIVVGILIGFVLPAGMSRSAWLASILSCLWVCAVHFSWHAKCIVFKTNAPKKFICFLILALSLITLVGYGLFYLKSNSADGRLLMWKIGVECISKHPLTGYGYKGFAKGFGDAQECYFAKGDYDAWEEAVAGSPEYTFNEYLQVGIEHGIPTLIVILGIIALAFFRGYRDRRIGICGAILSVLIFSFSSYPMQIPGFAIAFLLLISSCLLRSRISWVILCISFIGLSYYTSQKNRYSSFEAWNRAKMIYNMGSYVEAKKEYETLYPSLKDEGAFLFEYGHCLHKLKEYNLSTAFLKEAMEFSADPMILNILGKNYQALGRYQQAERWFIRSTHRLPGRIYPYYLLAKLYSDRSFYQPKKIEQMVQVVLTKEPKVQSTAVRQMREEAKQLLTR